MRIVYLTAGAAGMYCGSCLHDNTLAAALTRRGLDVQLIPTYTPIRTDEPDASEPRVFFGGINVYLQQKSRLFRWLPSVLDRFLDRPSLLRWATAGSTAIDPRVLGGLTVSMLRGERGYQRKEVRRLCRFLAADVQPQLIVLTNLLIGGCIPALKQALNVPVLVTLQGDDAFLEYLPEPYKTQALAELRRLVGCVDGYLVHSRFYAQFMAEYLGIPLERTHIVPLGIDTRDFAAADRPEPRGASAAATRPPTIGYLARLTPEKGLHVLVDALIALRRRPGMERVQLRMAGWLGEAQRGFAEAQFAKLREAGLEEAWCYVGEVDRRGKLDFLRSLDVFSVPTLQREPKGLFALEALAAGVPVVLPAHGAFPELIAATGGGRLTPPNNPAALADALAELLADPATRRRYAESGQRAVHQQRNADTMAEATWRVFEQYVPRPARQP